MMKEQHTVHAMGVLIMFSSETPSAVSLTKNFLFLSYEITVND